ncbi:MAG: L,D-transpeptidase [Rhodobacteraceae bacterium]|nr:L,D-transpeptidase [Paracoccaceae bacterium]
MQRRSFLVAAASALSLGHGGPAPAAQDFDATIRPSTLPDEMQPREIRIRNDFAPYEIHVDPGQFGLFWTLPDRRAIRYAVGIGRRGLYESGEFRVGAKKKWPSWTPTPEMIARSPDLYLRHQDGMAGGPDNPLGARALYLFAPGGGDTFLRIHGTNQPETIGKRVSNGCARLVNAHIVDLFDRVPLETRVVLYPIPGG